MNQNLSVYAEKINEKKKHYDCIAVYGTGKIGRLVYRFLSENSIKADTFCVTRLDTNCEEFEGVKVQAAKDLAKSKTRVMYLIACRKQTKKEIVDYLQVLNVPGNDVIDLTDLGTVLDGAYFRPVLEITPKIGCSVNCRFCPQALFVKRYFANNYNRAQEMSFENFKKCIDKTPQNLIVQFMGFVEPFLCKDITKMMRYVHNSGRDVTLSTTLVGLTLEQFKEIENIPFQFVMLHVPDKNNYAHIPMTDEYFEVLDYVLNIKRPDGSSFVDVANCQCEPHPQIVKRLANRLSVSWNMFDRAGNLNDDKLPVTVEKYGRLACVLSENLDYNVLLPDGTVVLCCMDWGLEYNLGNLLLQSYEEIINSKTLRDLKSAMNSEHGQILCRKCADSYCKME